MLAAYFARKALPASPFLTPPRLHASKLKWAQDKGMSPPPLTGTPSLTFYYELLTQSRPLLYMSGVKNTSSNPPKTPASQTTSSLSAHAEKVYKKKQM
jgi:hypothetical protein